MSKLVYMFCLFTMFLNFYSDSSSGLSNIEFFALHVSFQMYDFWMSYSLWSLAVAGFTFQWRICMLRFFRILYAFWVISATCGRYAILFRGSVFLSLGSFYVDVVCNHSSAVLSPDVSSHWLDVHSKHQFGNKGLDKIRFVWKRP